MLNDSCEALGLDQWIKESTHDSGHILDSFFTEMCSEHKVTECKVGELFTDHKVIQCNFKRPKII